MKDFIKTLTGAGLSEQYANAAWFTLSPRPETEKEEEEAAGRAYIRRYNLKGGKLPITVKR